MASDRAKRGGGRETDVSAAVNSAGANLPTPYQVTITYADPKAGIVQNNGADWFGPLNPMVPTAPPEITGRRFDFPAGYNLNQQPKAYEPVGFDTLRRLADGYDLMRIIIETRKDQLSTLNWNVVPRDPRTRIEGQVAERIKAVEAFFLRPDKVHFWDEWLRMIMEDLLVIDAPAVFKRRTKGGQLYALEPLDGGTIKCVIDDWGRTPEPPVPAYQQVLKGMPAVNYTTTDLLYRPRNRRTNKVYGYSPVEQVIMTVNIALRRQVFQLQYFTEGNIPEALIGVPETWTPDQIKQFQDWFDGLLQGNTGERRRARFVPNAVGKTYIPTKDNELFGKAEEWLARVICFAFSVNAQPFVQMMNRATAEQAGEDADATGIIPLKKYIKGLVDSVIIDDFGYDDVQFKWLEEDDEDTEKKQKRLSGYVADGLLSINEARIKMGEDPDPDPIFNELMMKTSMGYILIKNGPIQTNAATSTGSNSQTGASGQESTKNDQKEPPENPPAAAAEKVTNQTIKMSLIKAADGQPMFADVERPEALRAVKRLARRIGRELTKIGPPVGDEVVSGLVGAGLAKLLAKGRDDQPRVPKGSPNGGEWAKTGADNDSAVTEGTYSADEAKTAAETWWKGLSDAEQTDELADFADGAEVDDREGMIHDLLNSYAEGLVGQPRKTAGPRTLRKAAGDDDLDAIIKAINIGFGALETFFSDEMSGIYEDAGDLMLGAMGLKLVAVNDDAVKWSAARAAELVSTDASGGILTDTTRNMIRETIAIGLANGLSAEDIGKAVAASYAFSPERATVIAETEIARANSQGSLASMKAAKAAGVKVKKSWHDMEEACEICATNAAQGPIELEETFESGDDATPGHPRCKCAIVPVIEE